MKEKELIKSGPTGQELTKDKLLPFSPREGDSTIAVRVALRRRDRRRDVDLAYVRYFAEGLLGLSGGNLRRCVGIKDILVSDHRVRGAWNPTATTEPTAEGLL